MGKQGTVILFWPSMSGPMFIFSWCYWQHFVTVRGHISRIAVIAVWSYAGYAVKKQLPTNNEEVYTLTVLYMIFYVPLLFVMTWREFGSITSYPAMDKLRQLVKPEVKK